MFTSPQAFFDLAQAPLQPALRAEDLGEKPVLVFDTETAGLSTPGICQLSYVLSENGTLTEYDRVLKLPPTVRMSSAAVNIHKITAEASAVGSDPGPELLLFWQTVQRVLAAGGTVVGHNVSFDAKAFNFSCNKLGLTNELDARHFLCTMQSSKAHSHLLNARGHPKMFKLGELYTRLYGEPPKWATLHNSLDDVKVTALCFAAGRREGWW